MLKNKLKEIIDIKMLNCVFIFGIFLLAFLEVNKYSLIIVFTKSIKSIFRIIIFLLLLPKVLLQDYDKKDYVMIIVLYLLCVIFIIFGCDKNIIIIPTVLVGTKNIKISSIIRVIFIVNITSLIFHFVAFINNYYLLNDSLLNIFHFMWNDGNNNLMFRNRNMFAIRYLCAIMQYLYITDREKSRLKKTLIIALITIFVYQISNSITCFVICVYLLIYMLIENNKHFIKRIEFLKISSLLLSFLFTGFMIYIGFNIKNPFFEKIDNLLAWRPYYLSQMCDYVGINIFPNLERFNSIKEYFGNNVVIVPDNSYVAILLKWGMFLTLLLFAITYYFVFKIKNEKITNYFISAIFLLFSMEYVSNEYILYIIPLLVMSKYFNREDL